MRKDPVPPPRRTPHRGSLAALVITLSCLLAFTAVGLTRPEADSELAAAAFRSPDLYVSSVYTPAAELPEPLASDRLAALSTLAAQHGFVDRRSGGWGTLVLSRPLVPGAGAGNELSWSDLGRPAPESADQLEAATLAVFEDYLSLHQADLGFAPGELGPRTVTAVAGGQVVQIRVGREVAGVPVRGASLHAVVNGGNLILMGARDWGPVAVSPVPAVSAGAAADTLAAHLGRSTDGARRAPRLELVPTSAGDDPLALPVGEGLEHRLVWSLAPVYAGDLGTWEALVDAHSGELVSFVDTNHYATKAVRGGVFPLSNDGIGPEGTEQPGYAMPFADVLLDSGELVFSDSGGDLVCTADGSAMHTELSGLYVHINDNCGPIDENAADPNDLDLEFGPGTDCAVPPGHSPGDTHAARTGFFEVNRIQEVARGWLPDNAWLDSQLTANMNIDDDCNAFWNGSSINFYTSGGGCRNTGEIAAVFDHEWGHGMDANDANPSISSPGEAYADVASMLRLNASCIGRGFFADDSNCGGNGDPCLDCSGVRENDWAKRQSGQPHDLDWINSPTFTGRGGCVGGIFIPTQQGPCGFGTHCEGSVASQVIWDLFKRDLPAYAGAGFAIDDLTAQEMLQRFFYLGGGNLGDWYNCNPAALPGQHGDGCNADGAYLNFLALDDDNGNLGDGTPHMPALYAAFDRHQMACDQPVPVAGASCTRPTTAPNVTATPANKGAELSWDPVAGAEKYWIFRGDGILACEFGKARVGETAQTSFVDGGISHDRPYAYTVIPVGSADSCVGPASACTTVTPQAGADLAFTADEPTLASLSGGDGDPFIDNCETGRVEFAVRNTGTVSLTNVRVDHVEPVSHPGMAITDTPTFAPTLAPCGEATGSFEFVASGLAPNDDVVFRVDVTADELAGRTVSTVVRFIAAESDFSPVASRTWSFDNGLEGWRVVSGTFAHNPGLGGNGSLGYLESSALVDNQCDEIVSPVVRLSATSTLSLYEQFVIEAGDEDPIVQFFDRANVGLRDLASGERFTVSPDGGRLYNASGPNGVCATQGEPGWAGAGPAFLESTWSAAALDPGGVHSGRVMTLDVAYGTDPLISLAGFQFDEVTLTDFEEQVADAQPDACTPPPPPCGRIDDGDAAVDYRRGWHRRSDERASGGGYHRRMGQPGGAAPTARVTFEGDAVTYRYVASNVGGTADVFIDGVFQETVSYGAGGHGPEEPTFGHSRTWSGFGSGSHELVVEHRGGAVYVDGFEFACDDPQAGADTSAVEYRSATSTDTAVASEGSLILRSVDVGPADRHVSVVVEGSSEPLTVELLDPLGLLVASGEALLDGGTVSGLDAAVSAPGTYTLQVLAVPGSFDTLELSTAVTYETE